MSLPSVVMQLPTLIPMHADPDKAVPALSGWRWVTAWEWSWGAAIPIVLAVVMYVWGVRRLTRRGDRWPIARTISFLVGMALMAFALMGFLGAYDTVLFSIHMVQHMIITMIAPVAIAMSAPITLALRVLPSSPRRTLLRVIHSWVAKALLFPVVTFIVMVGTPFALYLTGMYDYTLNNDWAHDLLHLWMVVMGVAFFIPLLGVDPAPFQLPYPLRILLFFLTMPFHAFLGTAIMGASRLIGEHWYESFGRTWGLSIRDDQVLSGAILWSTGDFTMWVAMSAIVVQWVRANRRETARIDRELDRQEALAAREAARAARERYDEPDARTASAEAEDSTRMNQSHEVKDA